MPHTFYSFQGFPAHMKISGVFPENRRLLENIFLAKINVIIPLWTSHYVNHHMRVAFKMLLSTSS